MTQSRKEENIVAAMQSWADAFSAGSPDAIVSLYADDASLWGTLSSERRNNRELIHDYFDKLFVYSARKVVFVDSEIRFCGDVAICAGTYLLSWFDGEKEVEMPARYSLVFRGDDGDWLIVEHHSSMMPPG